MQIHLIDAGNTSLKLGLYVDNELHKVQRFAHADLDVLMAQITADGPSKIVISSVVAPLISEQLLHHFDGILLHSQSKLPITNAYQTQESLGMDRLCNAVAVASEMDTEYGVSIDIGTCVKFDLVHQTDGYLGGSISPGIDLRYKSLNTFTEKLPLLSNKTADVFVGTSTETSIRAGVIHGMKAEIEGFVRYYHSQFGSLTFFMTGGDASYFDLQVKNVIFADENLTLKGLFEIYKHNA